MFVGKSYNMFTRSEIITIAITLTQIYDDIIKVVKGGKSEKLR